MGWGSQRRQGDADLLEDAARRAAGHRVGTNLAQPALIDPVEEVMRRDDHRAQGGLDGRKAGQRQRMRVSATLAP